MTRVDNKGFTLIELVVTVVLLSIIIGIGAYSITAILTTAKEKDYQLLVKEIKTSVELYYQECKYVNSFCEDSITLGYLVDNGYLKGNSDNLGLVNTKDNNDIRNCRITFEYTDGNIIISSLGQNSTSSCPTSDNYNSK